MNISVVCSIRQSNYWFSNYDIILEFIRPLVQSRLLSLISEKAGKNKIFTVLKYHAMEMYPLLNMHHTMKTYWTSGGITTRILDLGPRWGWMVSFTSRPLYPRVRSPGIHWKRGWLGPIASLDAVAKRKNSHHFPWREMSPLRPAHSLVSVLNELPRLPLEKRQKHLNF